LDGAQVQRVPSPAKALSVKNRFAEKRKQALSDSPQATGALLIFMLGSGMVVTLCDPDDQQE